MAVNDDELSAMAIEELDAACAMPWPDIQKITPWGDSFTGFAPSGREVEIERRYLWAHEPEGSLRGSSHVVVSRRVWGGLQERTARARCQGITRRSRARARQ